MTEPITPATPVELMFVAPIAGAAYQFTVLAADPMVCRAAFRVQKSGSTDCYTVVVTDNGRVECSCKDHFYRVRTGKKHACKHVCRLNSLRRALAALSVLAAAAV